ncbi:MAG: hypothetical protein K2M07_05975 [Muribaculaceae bacterium]|nr:hypothetical protein [Muribaculaceae bacterium]
MKKILGSLAAILIILGFSSCDSRQSLAKNIKGSWTSAPDKITDTGTMSTGVIRLMDFIKTPSEAGGDFIMTAMVSVSSQLPMTDSVAEPVSITASGIATIRGTWAAHDDDEIAVVVEPGTFDIQVDSSAVVLSSNYLFNEKTSDMATLKPSAIEMVRNQIRETVQNDFLSIRKIDDIKIYDNMMSCEINDVDFTMRRQVTK